MLGKSRIHRPSSINLPLLYTRIQGNSSIYSAFSRPRFSLMLFVYLPPSCCPSRVDWSLSPARRNTTSRVLLDSYIYVFILFQCFHNSLFQSALTLRCSFHGNFPEIHFSLLIPILSYYNFYYYLKFPIHFIIFSCHSPFLSASGNYSSSVLVSFLCTRSPSYLHSPSLKDVTHTSSLLSLSPLFPHSSHSISSISPFSFPLSNFQGPSR